MSNKVFNFIRFLAEVAISAIGAIYYNLAERIGLPYGETVVSICAAVAALFGIFTQWQRWKYDNQVEENKETE